MLKILAFFFSSVRELIEIKNQAKNLLENGEKTIEYVLLQPVNRDDVEFITKIGSMWQDNEGLKWFVYSLRQDLMSNMLKDEKQNAEMYKNQINGIELIIKAFEVYKNKYEQIQIFQTKGNQ